MTGIVDYGCSNLRSVEKALCAAGETCVVSSDVQSLKTCDRFILPGVGAFGAGMRALNESGLSAFVKETAGMGYPLLGICLGMQLLLEEGDEGGRFRGLGLIPGRVEKLDVAEKIPHMGWNDLCANEDAIFSSRRETVYFVHSYYCNVAEVYSLAKTVYGIEFSSAIKNGNVYGFQFHPEKSGEAGLNMLKNFVKLKRS